MDKQLAAAQIVKECYITGNFEKLLSIITDDYEHHSFWVLEPMRGKETVIPYYIGKGNAIRNSSSRTKAIIVRISDNPKSVHVNEVNINGEIVHDSQVSIWADFGKACVLMEQEVKGETIRTLAIPTINDEGMMTQLLITEPTLFNLVPLEDYHGSLTEEKDMGWLKRQKSKTKSTENYMSVSDFFPYAVQYLHEEAAKKGFAKKGFILNEGLISMGNPFISEGFKSEPDLSKRTNSFYLSLAASNMQLGIVLARVLCTNRQYLLSGQFFDDHEDFEALYKELLIALKEDLHVTVPEWEDFRAFIVPQLLTLISPFLGKQNIEEYRVKAVSAYYLLGISIGLEKYEP